MLLKNKTNNSKNNWFEFGLRNSACRKWKGTQLSFSGRERICHFREGNAFVIFGKGTHLSFSGRERICHFREGNAIVIFGKGTHLSF